LLFIFQAVYFIAFNQQQSKPQFYYHKQNQRANPTTTLKNCLPAIFFLFASVSEASEGPHAQHQITKWRANTPGWEFCADLIIFITLMQQQ